ncbi:hypothetical protein [Herbihabitans rhizosphaerae]|uniref:hypothetical protein n=1 Tax=Herbihabitans rhizosphaerae TaxID=1872711 RepID=UPI001A924760|nr:hypothetical protein [Herbihabitans rhizosphaerae]
MHQAGGALHGARGASESCWKGPAGEAFRASALFRGQDADELTKIADRAKQALTVFAGDLDTVRARMVQARDVATRGGLVVTPDGVLPPGPAPGPAPRVPDTPITPDAQRTLNQAISTHTAAVTSHLQQVKAYHEARATVDDARRIEADAHNKLRGALEPTKYQASTLKIVSVSVASGTLSSIKSIHSTAHDLIKLADDLDTQAIRYSSTTAFDHAGRIHAARFAQASMQGAQNSRTLANRILTPVAQLPDSLRKGIAGSPGDLVAVTRHSSPWLKGTQKVLKGLPYIGTAFTISMAGVDVANGKPAGQAAAETAGGIAGGVAGGAAGGAVLGSVFPGVGTVIGGVVGGAVGGIVTAFGIGKIFG